MKLLYVGTLIGRKGQPVLLEALSRLTGNGVGARLTLVGQGPERPELERLADRLGVSDRVTFTGGLDHDRVRQEYARADVFCLPSFAEGVPVVLMEAMASGLPVVSTRIAGIPELVEDGEHGFVVRPGRADDLEQALAPAGRGPGAAPADGGEREGQGRERSRPPEQRAQARRPSPGVPPVSRRPDRSERPVIICFAGDVWDGRPHSRHHLMRRLAGRYEILWVDGAFLRSLSRLEQHEWRQLARKLHGFSLRTVEPHLHVLRPLPIPPAGRLGRQALADGAGAPDPAGAAVAEAGRPAADVVQHADGVAAPRTAGGGGVIVLLPGPLPRVPACGRGSAARR